MTTNNILNNQCLNDFTITRSNSGNINFLTVNNTSNTANSSASIKSSVAGTSAGDAIFQSVITSGTTWTWGADNSDSDRWKLNPSSSIGTGDVLSISSLGEVSILVGDLGVSRSNSGGIVNVECINDDATPAAASDSALIAQVTSGSAGDAYLEVVVASIHTYVWGIDQTDATLKEGYLNAGSARPSTANIFRKVTTSGEQTIPFQPAFLATHTVNQDNITGAGTDATINYTTEIFDQNGDYDGVNTFTAPVSGRYLLKAQVYLNNITAAMTSSDVAIVSSNRDYLGSVLNPFSVSQSTADISFNVSAIVDMDAADTAFIQIQVSSGAGDTADSPNSPDICYFCGSLIC